MFVALGCVVLVAISLAWSNSVGGQQTNAEPARAKIVPVVLLKAGEQKELLLSMRCTAGATRSGGLDVREVGAAERNGFQSSKAWNQNGVTVEVPSFDEGRKQASSPRFAPLKKAGIDAFSVKITAAKDAKPGAYNLHLADFTCNGTCETDFRVLVVEP
jgi:hypothetical protein